MKLTSLLQLVDKLQQAGKIYNLQQVCGVFGCVLRRTVQDSRLTPWGGGNKIEIVPHQTKICSYRFLSYLPKLQMTLLYFEIVMSFLKKKTNNQDIFVVVLMLICEWQINILLWLINILLWLIFACLL